MIYSLTTYKIMNGNQLDNQLNPFQRFLGLIKNDQKDIFYIYIFALLNGAVALTLPLGIQAIVNYIQTGRVTSSWMVLVAIVIAGILLNGWFQIMQIKLSERIQQRIFTRSAFEFSFRLPRLLLEVAKQYALADIANRFFDTISVQKGLAKVLIDIISAVALIVFGLILLVFYHPFFIIFGLLILSVLVIILRFTFKPGLQTSLQESKYKYKTAFWLEELARSYLAFKMTGGSLLPLEKTNENVKEYLGYRQKHFKILLMQFWVMIGFKTAIALGLLLIGGLLVINQQMNIGQFIAAEIIILLILSSVEKLITGMDVVYDMLTSVEKLGHFTDLPIEDESRPSHLVLAHHDPVSVTLKGIKLKYEDALVPIFTDVTMSIPAGSRVCLQGPSGTGKTSLLKLLAGLIEPTEGSVEFNQVDIQQIRPTELRKTIGLYLNQDQLFNGSIFENIHLGRADVERQFVFWAIKNVGLSSFIQHQPQGVDTLLDNAIPVPFLVQEKILLARHFCHDPGLLLIDHNLDGMPPLEFYPLMEFLLDKQRNWTLFINSNDPELAAKCDYVVVFKSDSVTINKTGNA